MEDIIFSLLSAALIQKLDAAGCYIRVTPREGLESYDIHLHNGSGLEINKAHLEVSNTPDMMIVGATLIIEDFSETLSREVG